jgi:hypothetical protein
MAYALDKEEQEELQSFLEEKRDKIALKNALQLACLAIVDSHNLDPCLLIDEEDCEKLKSNEDYDCCLCRMKFFIKKVKETKNEY